MNLDEIIKSVKYDINRSLTKGEDADTSTWTGRTGILLTRNEAETLIETIEHLKNTKSGKKMFDAIEEYFNPGRPRYSSVEDEELFTRYFSSVMTGILPAFYTEFFQKERLKEENSVKAFNEALVASAVVITEDMIEEHRTRFSKKNTQPVPPPPQVKKPTGTIQ